MKRQKQSSQRASRMDRYVPLIREFAARDGLFHEAVAKTIGMHSTDEKVLRLLGADTMTAGDLVSHTGLTGAAVTALVDRLIKLGYVTRERDTSDRRKVVIRAVNAKLGDINQLWRVARRLAGAAVEIRRSRIRNHHGLPDERNGSYGRAD
jgi:DNA-binding MarR family transcriptional regulator